MDNAGLPTTPESEDKRRELRREQDREAYKLLDCRPNYFIHSERLGLIEQAVSAMAHTPGKRKRAVEFNRLEQVLKGLKLINSSCKIVGLAYGCLDSGEAGMFIVCNDGGTKVIGQLPEGEK